MPPPRLFIFSCSMRCGSTWLQRILTSSGEVLVWGEPPEDMGGPTTVLALPRHKYLTPARDVGNPWDLHEFRRSKANMWSAMLHPPQPVVQARFRDFMEDTWGISAIEEGYPDWGMKVTVWAVADLRSVRAMWPSTKIVFLIRDFTDCFYSRYSDMWLPEKDTTSRAQDVWHFCETWLRQASAIWLFREDPGVRLVRYESLVEAIPDLTRWLGLEKTDPAQWQPKIGAGGGKDFVLDDLKLVEAFKTNIDELNALFGYDPFPLEQLRARLQEEGGPLGDAPL